MRDTGPAHLIPLDFILLSTFYDAYCKLFCVFGPNRRALRISKTLVPIWQITQCHNVNLNISGTCRSYSTDLVSAIFLEPLIHNRNRYWQNFVVYLVPKKSFVSNWHLHNLFLDYYYYQYHPPKLYLSIRFWNQNLISIYLRKIIGWLAWLVSWHYTQHHPSIAFAFYVASHILCR